MLSICVSGFGDDGFTGGSFELKMTGHARFSAKGTDIVCSAASVLFLTLQIALVETAGAKIDFGRCDDLSFIRFSPDDSNRETAKIVLSTIIAGFKALAANYPEHCKITI